MSELLIVKIESFEGEDTFLRCGDSEQDYLFCVVSVEDDSAAEIVDSGYRSEAEARAAWPEIKRHVRPRTQRVNPKE